MGMSVECPHCKKEIIINKSTKGYSDIGRKIIQLRFNKNWTQGDLAKRLNTTKNQIIRWEKGYHQPNKLSTVEIDKLIKEDEKGW